MSKYRSIRNKLIITALAGVTAMSLLMTGCADSTGKTNSSNTKSKSSSTSETTVVSKAESKFGNDIAVKSKNYQISLPVMQYLFRFNYEQNLANYGTYMSQYYGFDSTVDLRSQYYNQESNMTWYDYFMEMTTQYMEQTLVIAEAAKEAKVELDENDLQEINDTLEAIQNAATSKDQKVEEYITDTYGKGVSLSDIEESLKLTALSRKYYDQVYNGYKYTDKDYEDYYNANKTSYQFADFMTFEFKFTSDSSDSSQSSVSEDDKQRAKAFADDLAKCKTKDEFEKYIKDYLTAHPEAVTAITQTSDDTVSESSEAQLKQAIETQVSSAYITKYNYEATSDAGKWIFDATRKANDSTVLTGSDGYSVVLLLKPAYRDESINKNVRHILLTAATYGTEEKAKAKADEVYKEWQNGEKTEESFAELAKKYSTDTGSSSNGGLYENVPQGQMVAEFNDWIFDKSRKPGDSGIVKTTYGYHIMYFVGDSMEAWKSSVDAAKRQEDYKTDYAKWKETYPVEFDDEYLNNIEVSVASNSSETSSASSQSNG